MLAVAATHRGENLKTNSSQNRKAKVIPLAHLDRNTLIERNLDLVKIIAGQVSMHLPQHIEMDDLISAGTIGLVEAADKFDVSRGVQFRSYASTRVRGAIIDDLRAMDWMTRSMRVKSNRLEKAYSELSSKLGRQADAEEVASHLGISNEDIYSMLREVCATSLVNLEDLGISDSQGASILDCIENPKAEVPSDVYKYNEVRAILAEAVNSIPDNEKFLISLYYYDELTMKEVGSVLDVSESRVCQLHSQAMMRLKGMLKELSAVSLG